MDAGACKISGEYDLEWLEDACLGCHLSAEVEREMRLAAMAYHDPAQAERHLRSARDLAPEHPAVYIGLYRYYFYQNRLVDALNVARECLALATGMNGLNVDWRGVRVGDAEFGRYESVLPRFYLFTLKGYAYLNLRLGNIEEGRAAVDKLMELDHTDKLGGRVLMQVLDRQGVDDDE